MSRRVVPLSPYCSVPDRCAMEGRWRPRQLAGEISLPSNSSGFVSPDERRYTLVSIAADCAHGMCRRLRQHEIAGMLARASSTESCPSGRSVLGLIWHRKSLVSRQPVVACSSARQPHRAMSAVQPAPAPEPSMPFIGIWLDCSFCAASVAQSRLVSCSAPVPAQLSPRASVSVHPERPLTETLVFFVPPPFDASGMV